MVTNNHYRWDFIGLSTDVKPTPATSEKVVDGSTYYCADNSKLYVYCKDNWYERKALGGGGGGSYTAGTGIDITDSTISVDTTVVQEKLTAGSNITISDNTISATADTVYSDKTTSNQVAGGAVYIGSLNASQEEQPDPTQTDEHYKYFWAIPYNNNYVPAGGSINIMGSYSSDYSVVVGEEANVPSIGTHSVAVGEGATVRSQYGVSIGSGAYLDNNKPYSVALGARAVPTRSGEVNIGTGSQAVGYDSTTYRVLGGVHDGQLAQDAVTVAQVNATIDAINTALSTNIPHIGA